MLRLVVMIFRVILYIPSWLYYFHIMQNKEKYSVQERYDFIYKFVHRLVKNLNVTVTFTGYENLPKEDGYILTPNHQGLFDALALLYTNKRPITAIVKQELIKIPVLKQIVIVLDAKPMDRSNLRSSIKVIRATSKEVAAGRNYVIFPEGTRSKDGRSVGEFKGGSFKVAIDAKAPIVPVALINCSDVLDKNSLRRIDTEVHYLTPIYYNEYEKLSSTEIAELVKSRINFKIEERTREL